MTNGQVLSASGRLNSKSIGAVLENAMESKEPICPSTHRFLPLTMVISYPPFPPPDGFESVPASGVGVGVGMSSESTILL